MNPRPPRRNGETARQKVRAAEDAEIGTPLASPQAAPVEPTPADFQRLLAIAPRYGLEVIAPEQH
jgi:hypothetical protein